MNTMYGIASMAVTVVLSLIWHLDELLTQRNSDFSLPKRNLPQKIHHFLVASELLWVFYSKCFFLSRIWTCSFRIFCQRNLHFFGKSSDPSIHFLVVSTQGLKPPKISQIFCSAAGRGALCGAPEPSIYTGWMMGDVNISFHQSELNPGFGVFRRSLVY